jgi:hypothetical protein
MKRLATLIPFLVVLGCGRSELEDAPSEVEQAMGALTHCATMDFGAPEAPRTGTREELARYRVFISSASPTQTINVAFHVVTSDTGEGSVTDEQISQQMDALNRAFVPYGLSFVLARVDRTTNKRWFELRPGANERRMKEALANNPGATLNVYTAQLEADVTGWTYYPWSMPREDAMHGVVLHHGTLPGGALAPYNRGAAAVHQVGHYLGLFHTFEGGCDGEGDYCLDTPAQAIAGLGATAARDTCSAPGKDPVTNFMDFSDDALRSTFTIDQGTRMHWAIGNYRPGL